MDIKQPGGVRVLLWGDVNGNFVSFAEHLNRVVDRYGAFDICICLGVFFGNLALLDDPVSLVSKVCELLPPRLPVPKVVILDSSPPGSIGAALHEAFPAGISSLHNTTLAPDSRITTYQLLGTRGVCTIAGLQVSFLRSHDPRTAGEDGDILVADGMTDLCLLTEWPVEIAHGVGLNEEDRRSLQSVLESEGVSLPPLSASDEQSHKAFLNGIGLARYIVAAGPPGIFYQRPAFEIVKDGNMFSRFIGLASMPAPSRMGGNALPVSAATTRKFTHSLKLIPLATEACSTWKRPVSMSQNPFGFHKPSTLIKQEVSSEESNSEWPWQVTKKRRLHDLEGDTPPTPAENDTVRPRFAAMEPVSKSFGGDTAITLDASLPDWAPVEEGSFTPSPPVLLTTKRDMCKLEQGTPPKASEEPPAVKHLPEKAGSDKSIDVTGTTPRRAKSRWGSVYDESNEPRGGSGDTPSLPAGLENGSAALQRVVYLLNVPFAAARWQIWVRMSDFGEVVDTRFPRGTACSRSNGGRAWVTYSTSEGAARAVKHGEILFMNRHMKAMFALNQDPTKFNFPRTAGEGDAEKKDVIPEETEPTFSPFRTPISIDTRPQSDCWFCLCNPNSEKKLIISIGQQAYLTISRGGLVPQHLMILPVSHQPSMAVVAPPAVKDEIRSLMMSLRGYFHSQGQAVVFLERYVPMKVSKALHTQVHAVPIPRHLIADCYKVLHSRARVEGLRLVSLKGAPFSGMDSVLTDAYAKGPRPAEPSVLEYPYWWIDLPSEGTEKAPADHATESRTTYLGVTSSLFQRLNLNFAREVLATVLSAPERILWKNCITTRLEEEQWAKHVRSSFEAYKQQLKTTSDTSEAVDTSLAVSPTGCSGASYGGPSSSSSSSGTSSLSQPSATYLEKSLSSIK
eukprot:Blabericola_migrator_1__6810@NODE_344_length_9579_cov_221_075799_g277_i0_p1_GENE_NODE_344_length_9579_cov_221_075799_g277_i0NODE_344_length_9579_cov_221_075799_g277_i0_p1_ORF_typecomplete_len905_score103_03CwfJ_C_1/PF04677_15/8_9e32CwfJ_C_2/PF04676_14/4_7e09RRM_1/PF00076_22/0_0004Nup35_RRM_2/PF14605_6/0_074_NODE_344_length_9579_cov_221_075799_g277_i06753389